MKSGKKDVLAELRAGIAAKQIAPAPAPARAQGREVAPPSAKGAKKSTAPVAQQGKAAPAPKALRSGRGVQFYLDDADRKLISNLAVLFASQDRRVSDSQVVKVAIRFASVQPSGTLLQICDEVRATDRRRHSRKGK